jgi:hypothetical protein
LHIYACVILGEEELLLLSGVGPILDAAVISKTSILNMQFNNYYHPVFDVETFTLVLLKARLETSKSTVTERDIASTILYVKTIARYKPLLQLITDDNSAI